MRYVVLAEVLFKQEYHRAFEKQELADEVARKRFRDDVFKVQGAIEDALLRQWTKTDDFEVGWDFNYCYHTCGGIYSDRVFCPEYVFAVAEALQSVDQAGRWTYHTVCEIVVNPKGKTLAEMTEERGEFFIRGDVCYIDGTTMKREWRSRLGSRD